MNDMERQMVGMVKEALGEDASVEAVVRLMVQEHVITPKRMRRVVIRREFFRRLADPAVNASALSIEMDLAAQHGISVRSVQAFRSRTHKMK